MALRDKDEIKARMIQNAARLWGLKDAGIEMAFDPLVTMLIEGCVNEIEKINTEIRNTETRVIKHLARLITPELITGFRPAHAVMQATPVDEKIVIQPEHQFYYTKKNQSDNGPKTESNTDIYFSPVGNFTLLNAAVRYLACHDSIYENTNAYQKKQVVESEHLKQLEYGCVWLGLETNQDTGTQTELSFYFNIKSNAEKNFFINLLPYTKWSCNGIQLAHKQGLAVAEYTADDELSAELSADKRYMLDVLSQYNQHFITLNSLFIEKHSYPEVFDTIFSVTELRKLSGGITWIKVEFSPAVNAMLPDLICGINCFPVVNKKLNEFAFRLSQNLNIVPLKTADYFFAMKGVYSQDGNTYSDSPLNNAGNVVNGTYLLRQGGTDRFDSRNASEMITYLLNLVRDESGAFTVYGNEFISSNLKQLNQTLALIEQRLSTGNLSGEAPYYLFVSPFKEGENIFVAYWTTNGHNANNIKAGSRLELYGSGELKNDSLVMITTTRGGRAKLDDTESLTAFKSAQLSRDRIVTPQDIRMACFHELGNQLEEVTVKKGFMIPGDIKSGFVPTVEVKLTPAKNNRSTKNEWADICENLSTKIMKKSTGLTTVRVMVDNDPLLYTPVSGRNWR